MNSKNKSFLGIFINHNNDNVYGYESLALAPKIKNNLF